MTFGTSRSPIILDDAVICWFTAKLARFANYLVVGLCRAGTKPEIATCQIVADCDMSVFNEILTDLPGPSVRCLRGLFECSLMDAGRMQVLIR